jgi:transposase
MSLKPLPIGAVPQETARLAKAVFPEGSTFMKMRDELGTLYQDEMFAALFPKDGQPALAPWRLALVTIMQFTEGLSDRQAAQAVRARLDWKYALGLELEDRGFDFSVLSEFRARLIEGKMEHLLFETMLNCLKQRGLGHSLGGDSVRMRPMCWQLCARSTGSSVWAKRCVQRSIPWRKWPQSGYAPLPQTSGMSAMSIGWRSIGCQKSKPSARPLLKRSEPMDIPCLRQFTPPQNCIGYTTFGQ